MVPGRLAPVKGQRRPAGHKRRLGNCAKCSLTQIVPKLGTAMRKSVAAIIGIVVAAIAVGVVVGMVRGADPTLSKGRSTTASVVTQEVVGAMTLVALFGAFIGCVSVARGNNVRRLLIPLLVGLVLAAGWWFSYVAERAN